MAPSLLSAGFPAEEMQDPGHVHGAQLSLGAQ